MAKKHLIKTEQDILDEIGAQDWRSIKKEQLINFVTSIPNMDKELAIKCIEQFPNFKDYSQEVIKCLFLIYNDVINDNKQSRNDTIATYKSQIDMLNELSLRENTSPEDKRFFIETSVEISHEIFETHKMNNDLLHKIINSATAVCGGAIMVGGALLGAKIYNDRNK